MVNQAEYAQLMGIKQIEESESESSLQARQLPNSNLEKITGNQHFGLLWLRDVPYDSASMYSSLVSESREPQWLKLIWGSCEVTMRIHTTVLENRYQIYDINDMKYGSICRMRILQSAPHGPTWPHMAGLHVE